MVVRTASSDPPPRRLANLGKNIPTPRPRSREPLPWGLLGAGVGTRPRDFLVPWVSNVRVIGRESTGLRWVRLTV